MKGDQETERDKLCADCAKLPEPPRDPTREVTGYHPLTTTELDTRGRRRRAEYIPFATLARHVCHWRLTVAADVPLTNTAPKAPRPTRRASPSACSRSLSPRAASRGRIGGGRGPRRPRNSGPIYPGEHAPQ